MITYVSGDLLKADAQALVNPVNCVGVMGKGLALQFKQAYPGNDISYRAACERGELRPGTLHVYQVRPLGQAPRWIVNVPTKRHWRDASRIEDVESGLGALVAWVQQADVRSIAVPALGCGLGGLAWSDVRPLIDRAFDATPDVRVLVYGPER